MPLRAAELSAVDTERAKPSTRAKLVTSMFPSAQPGVFDEFLATGASSPRPWMANLCDHIEDEIDRRVDADIALLIAYVQANPGLTKAQILSVIQGRVYRG